MFENLKIRFDTALAALLIAALGVHFLHLMPAQDFFILVGATALATIPVFWNAVRSLGEGDWASMDMLASIALVFSILGGEFSSAVFIGLMLASSRILSELNASRAEAGIKGLLKLRPAEAKVERGGKVETIPVEAVSVGDVVVVDLGDRIPVDGHVISGSAAVDESSLTGESVPVDKTAGSKIMSSTVVVAGSVRLQTDRIGKDTTLERIIALVSKARSEKPKAETLGESFGKIYLVAMLVGSAILYAVSRDIALVLSVVLVVCADDIAIAIPIAYLRAIGLAAKNGVIVKGGKHLEVLGTIDTLVLDKTGTLTKGKLAVEGIFPEGGTSVEQVLRAAALAAKRSTHPLSRAVIAYAAEKGITVGESESAEELGGKGVRAEAGGVRVALGKKAFFDEHNISVDAGVEERAMREADKGRSISYVSANDRIIGFISAADEVKPEAKRMIEDVKKLGVKRVVMLTGDNKHAAHAIAKRVGITDVYAQLLPADKVASIKKLQEEGSVAMVGDGVNDAAALSVANVGIAMGGLGAEGTLESAQIILMRDDLSQIPLVIGLARTVRRISYDDFWIWGATNAAGLVLVFMGFIGPPGAAAYNFISDFFPLLNSFRVRIPNTTS